MLSWAGMISPSVRRLIACQQVLDLKAVGFGSKMGN
jgi:hypothetical protein